jgi:hypothetical protein
MKARLDFRQTSPEGMNAMSRLHTFVHDCGLFWSWSSCALPRSMAAAIASTCM